MKTAGVRIIFEAENLDTDEVDSNLMISIMESFAQTENESRSVNIRMGLAMRAVNGTSADYNGERVQDCSGRKEKAKQYRFR